jgi:hypothetical protein
MPDPRVVGLLAYVGPGPGLEFVPYFFSLLTWIGLALAAVLLWPITVLWRRLRRRDNVPQQGGDKSSQNG